MAVGHDSESGQDLREMLGSLAVFLRGCVSQEEAAQGDLMYGLSECSRQLSGGKETLLAEQLLDPSMCHLSELYVPSSEPWKCLLFRSCLAYLKPKGMGRLDPLITPFFLLPASSLHALHLECVMQEQRSLNFTYCSNSEVLKSKK